MAKIMKKLLTILIASVLVTGVFAKDVIMKEYDWKITRVVDGDTVAFEADFLPEPLKKELSIRVYGVDTPEKGFRGQCDKEKAAGEAASAFTKKLLKEATITKVAIWDWDKYGGRVLGDIILDGKSLRKQLIDNGYAREYYGEAKQSWCN
jgi:endonuclease YncB( thermonuclease family)